MKQDLNQEKQNRERVGSEKEDYERMCEESVRRGEQDQRFTAQRKKLKLNNMKTKKKPALHKPVSGMFPSIPSLPAVLHDETGEYPSDEALEFIKKFDCAKYGCLALAEFIRDVWWAAEWGYLMKGKRMKRLYLSTGGWSGNEYIISALQDNYIFWTICWRQTRRGGHYIFEIREANSKNLKQ